MVKIVIEIMVKIVELTIVDHFGHLLVEEGAKVVGSAAIGALSDLCECTSHFETDPMLGMFEMNL